MDGENEQKAWCWNCIYSGVFIIRDSPTYAKKAAKTSRFAHEIFSNAFPPEKRKPLVNMLPILEHSVNNEENVKFPRMPYQMKS
jgi:hypothetical protein